MHFPYFGASNTKYIKKSGRKNVPTAQYENAIGWNYVGLKKAAINKIQYKMKNFTAA